MECIQIHYLQYISDKSRLGQGGPWPALTQTPTPFFILKLIFL